MLPHRRLLAVAFVAAVLACSDSNGPAVSLAKLAGTWDLTRSDMLLASDTSVSDDLMAGIGLEAASIAIHSDGSAVLITTFSGSPPDTGDATVDVHGDTLDLNGYLAKVHLSGRTMTWLALQSTSWDIDNDGTPDTALERDVWHKR